MRAWVRACVGVCVRVREVRACVLDGKRKRSASRAVVVSRLGN